MLIVVLESGGPVGPQFVGSMEERVAAANADREATLLVHAAKGHIQNEGCCP